jgi:S-DNA-T family DNA segregation ATPase FtsK/SpoIIIE
MGRKKKTTKKTGSKIAFELGLKDETKHGVFAIFFFVIGIVFILSAFDYAGIAGTMLYNTLDTLLGVGYYLLPILFMLLGIAYFRSQRPTVTGTVVFGSFLFLASGLGGIDILTPSYGGIIGHWIAFPLVTFFDVYASIVFLIALFAIALLILFNTHFSPELFFFWRREKDADEYEDEDIYLIPEQPEQEDEEEPKEEAKPSRVKKFFGKSEEEEEFVGIPVFQQIDSDYVPPPLSLLSRDRGKPGVGDVKATANSIKRTFQNFGIDVEMDEVSIGPSVTRYALKPAEGVRLSKIIGLQKNLELALAAHPVRIEAPIPGKSLVGIEVPNTSKTTVGLGTLLRESEFKVSTKPLLFSLGKSVAGVSFFDDLAKMPHALIAGATGAGKSVTIHTTITSLLYRNSPDQLRFVMVDPKRVELTLYNGIPHLLTPVITDPKKAILALKWLIKEMERRYQILEGKHVRDIHSYHETILGPAVEKIKKEPADTERTLPEAMPYIVVIIDELADIMATYPRELESSIVRLAQMSRAVGIHLVLSTQRPSVNVITGLIKANVPGRIALQVASQIDSRTILDMSGAEKLLGAGDMLYLSGNRSKPIRLQSAFISEDEVKKVVAHLKNQRSEDDLEDELELTGGDDSLGGFGSDDGFDDEDDLYEDAREAIIEAGKASTSYLQRKLRIGYSRAARIMDMLQERGVIGEQEGSKPRDILIEESNETEETFLSHKTEPDDSDDDDNDDDTGLLGT